MSDSTALSPSSLLSKRETKPASPSGFRARLAAAMEALVAAHSHRFPENETLFYRYPPV